jgi:hypothetical protein
MAAATLRCPWSRAHSEVEMPPRQRRRGLESVLAWIWEMLIGRVHGPFAFQLIIQPLVATFFTARAAIRDARAGRPPYDWALLTNRRGNPELVRECRKKGDTRK